MSKSRHAGGSPTRRLDLIAIPVLTSVPVLFGVLLLACGGHEATAPGSGVSGAASRGKNAVVRVSPASDTLDALYDTLQLSASAEVSWSSLTPAVAAVDAEGRVVSVGPGLALIEALGVGGRKADTAEILVRQLAAGLQVTPDSLEMFQGGEDTLIAAVTDRNGYPIVDALVDWVSDQAEIATVSQGIVTGVDTGTTTIRASIEGHGDTTRVVVLPNPYP